MNIFRKYNLIFKTTFFSILVFLGSFNVVWAGKIIDATLKNITSFIGSVLLYISSQILALAGTLFNISLQYTLNFKALVDSTGVVNIGWTIIRDMSNMAFIFILLSVAIGTILGLSGHNAKNTIKNIILAALFINFSLFITNVIIDASNVIAIGFYNATIQEAGAAKKGISEIFSQSLNLKSIYDADKIKLKEGETIPMVDHEKIFIIGILGSLLMLITAFVFFAAAILFIIRTVVLMFLMMISPIAFIGSILPKTQPMAKKWWTELFNQAFFAPIYLMFIYIVARGVTSPAFKATLSNANDTTGFTTVFTGGAAASGAMIVVFNFILLIALLLGSLISAKSMGAKGGDFATSMAGKASFGLAAMTGRRTVGGVSNWLANKTADSRFATTGIGKLALKNLGRVADSSFDVRNIDAVRETGKSFGISLTKGQKGGYATTQKEAEKAQIKYAKGLKGDALDIWGNPKFNSDGSPMGKSEAYGETLGGRTIWGTLAGTTSGDRGAAKALAEVPKLEREIKENKARLKTDPTIKTLKGTLNKETESLRRLQENKAEQSEIETQMDIIDSYKDNIEEQENKIKEEIKKVEDKLKKAKGKTTIKDEKKEKEESK